MSGGGGQVNGHVPVVSNPDSGPPDDRNFLQKMGDWGYSLVHVNDFSNDISTAFSGDENFFLQSFKASAGIAQTAATMEYPVQVQTVNAVGAGSTMVGGIAGRAITAPIARNHPEWALPGQTGQQYQDMVNNSIFDTDAKASPAQIWGADASTTGFDKDPLASKVFSNIAGQNVNPYDDAQRAKFFTNSDAPARWSTGFIDAAVSSFFDPTNLAGPAFKGAKAIVVGERMLTSAPKIGLGLTKIAGPDFMKELAGPKFQELRSALISETSPARIRVNGWVNNPANLRDPDTFSHLMAIGAKDDQSFLDTWMVVGHTGTAEDVAAAAGRLAAANPESGSLPYLLDRIQNGMAEKIYAHTTGSDLILDPAITASHAGIAKDLLGDSNSAFATAYQNALKKATEAPAGMVVRTPWRDGKLAAMSRAHGEAKANSLFGGGDMADPVVTTIQPTSSHPVMNVIDYFTKGRPSGIIGIHDGDRFNEFTALTQHWDKYTNGAMSASGETKGWADMFLSAQNAHDAMTVSTAMEGRAFGMLAAKRGLSEEDARFIYDHISQKRMSGIQAAKENGFFSTYQDGEAMASLTPQLQRQAANEIHMGFDFRQLDKALGMHSAEDWKNILAHAKGNPDALGVNDLRFGKTVAGMDKLNNLFKMNVLLRLGYTIRNVSEAYLSMAASGFLGSVAMTAVHDTPQVAKNWVNNTARWGDGKLDKASLRLGTQVSDASLDQAAAEHLATIHVLDANHELATTYLRGHNIPYDQLDPKTVQHIAAIRGEMDRSITYHVTRDGLPEINGDFLSTHTDRAAANSALSDAYNYHSVENYGHTVDLPTSKRFRDPDTGKMVTINPVATGGEVGAPAKRGAAVQSMMEDAQRMLSAGKHLDYRRRGGDWAPLTQAGLDGLTERTEGGVLKMGKGEDSVVLRSRDTAKPPEVFAIPSYGKHVDFTDGRTVPAGVDVTDKASLAAYARENGIGRITVKDGSGKQTLVLRDTAEYKGGDGVAPIVKRNVDAIVAEGEKNAHVEVLPRRFRDETRTNRSANAAAAKAYPSAQPRPPIVPGFHAADIQAKMDGGLVDSLKAIGEQKAQTIARLQTIEAASAQRATKVNRLYGPKARIHQGPGESGDSNSAQGFVMQSKISSMTTNEHLLGNGDMTSVPATAGGPTKIHPDDPKYYEGWATSINHYVKDEAGNIDPLYKQFFDGKSNGEVEDWLNGAGRQFADEIGWHGDLEQYIAAARTSFDAYLPKDIQADILAGKPITKQYLRQTQGRRLDLPVINAKFFPGSPEQRSVLMADGLIQRMARRTFTMLGTIPETTLAREPLYNVAFKREVSRFTGELKGHGVTDISKDEMDKILFHSREHARQTVNRVLYTINRRTDASRQLRFISPFYAAWENSIKRWSGFAYHNPDTFARFASKAHQLAANAIIVDRNGDQQDLETVLNDYSKFQDAQVLMPGTDLSKVGAHDRVSLQSFDVITGGQPGPGFGPMAMLPVWGLVQARPDLADSVKSMFPAGIPASIPDMLISGLDRRVKSAITEDATYVNLRNKIFESETIKFAKGQRDKPPTAEEVEGMTKQYYVIRSLSSLLSPGSVQFGTDADFYINKLRTLNDLHRGEPNGAKVADDEFLKQYPEAWVVLAGLSKNNTGAFASVAAVDNLKRYSNLAAYAESGDVQDPKLTGFVANFGLTYGKNDFSPAAYQWQTNNDAGFGGSKYRTPAQTTDIESTARVDLGWVQFGKAMDEAETQLTAMGVTPQTDPKKYAQTMRGVRSLFDQQMQTQNPLWHDDYRDSTGVKFDRRARFFQKVFADQQFMGDHGSDPSVQYMTYYLSQRNQVALMLRDRKAQGGSQSLSANQNQDLADSLDTVVNAMKTKNIQFASWYDRYFTNDPVIV